MAKANSIDIERSLRTGRCPIHSFLLCSAAIAISMPTLAYAQVAGESAASAPVDQPQIDDQAATPTVQDAPAETARSQDTSGDIVVTGTSLRGVAPVGSPLIQLDRKQILETGAQTGAALFATIPQIDSFGSRPRQGGDVNVNTPPTLRGLPGGSTLSLLNGHRLVASGTISTVADPSTIPLAALGRLEVLADGASATYGSDAIGGVINVILRKDFNGVEASGLVGIDEDYQEQTASLVAGKTWGSGSLLVAYEYFHNSALVGSDRNYVTGNLASRGGFDGRSNLTSAPNVIVGGQNFYYNGTGFTPGTVLLDDQKQIDIIPTSIRHTGIANLRQDIGDSIHLFGDANYGNIKTVGNVPQLTAYLNITNANPYFKSPIPGATSETLLYRFSKEFGERNHNDSSLEYYGGSLGADIDISEKWHGQILGNYGRSHTTLILSALGSPDFVALQTALDSTNPATAFDPFDGRSSAATISGLFQRPNTVQSVQKLYQAAAKVDGNLFALPGGDVKLAFGGEFRRETYVGQNAGGSAATPFYVERGSDRNVASAYGELYVPLVSEANEMPFVHKLAVDATVRYDHYSDFGDTTNPKIGVEFSPVRELTLRGTYSKSFQAPSLADLNSIDAQIVFLPGIYIPNIYTPVEPGLYNILLLAGGNPDLQPQKATTYTVGGDLKLGSSFRFSATYYNVKFTNAISAAIGAYTNPALFERFIIANPTQAQIDAATALSPSIGGVPIPAGQLDYIADLRRFNLGKQNIEGLDFGPEVDIHGLGEGILQVGANGNYVFKNESQPAPGASFINNLQSLSNPRWRVRGYANWLNGPLAANAFVNYVGEFNNTAVSPVQRVKAFTTVDLNLSYDIAGNSIAKGLALQLNVQNLFDKYPPLLASAPGFSQAFANPIGRLIQVGARVKF